MRYEEHLDRAAAMGCDVFRLGIEWARIEPEPGQIDSTAFDRYEAILAACAVRGMEPLVTLHHFTHPAWLGDDFWLSSESPDLFAEWVALVVDRLGHSCRHWITMNELNIISFANYVIGIYPPGRRMAFGDFHSATAHLLAAHVKGYEKIHARMPGAFVSTNNSAASIYEYDRMFVDLLLAPGSGIAREDLENWLSERRRAWYRAIDPPSRLESMLRRASAAASPIASTSFVSGRPRRDPAAGAPSALELDPAIDAIYASPIPLRSTRSRSTSTIRSRRTTSRFPDTRPQGVDRSHRAASCGTRRWTRMVCAAIRGQMWSFRSRPRTGAEIRSSFGSSRTGCATAFAEAGASTVWMVGTARDSCGRTCDRLWTPSTSGCRSAPTFTGLWSTITNGEATNRVSASTGSTGSATTGCSRRTRWVAMRQAHTGG